VSQPPSRSRRETRLLVVTLAVSVVLLLVLARFRFPEQAQQPGSQVVVTPPLQQLSARATYDDLSRIMSEVERRVVPSTLVLDVQTSEESTAGAVDVATRALPALRIRDSMALVALRPNEEVVGILGRPDEPVYLVGRDEVRGLAVVEVPVAPAPALSIAQAATTVSNRYVALVEASRSGPSVRPLFLGRTEVVEDLRWQQPLASLGGSLTAQPGSLVFTLDGDLVGLVTAEDGLPALVPAGLVLVAATELAQGRSRKPGDLGVTWQPLTPVLSRATGVSRGVVVSGISGGGPSEGLLQPGDVVHTINGHPVRSISEARLAEAGLVPGQRAIVSAFRGSELLELAIVPFPAARQTAPAVAAPASAELGLVLRVAPAGIAVVRVAPGTAAEAAGLREGDVITHLDRQPVTRMEAVTRAWDEAVGGRAFLLTIARENTTVVLALEKP
jgi:hypothetical protein